MFNQSSFKTLFETLWAFKLFLQKLVLVITTAGFTVLVMIEIIFRYFLFLPLHGLEELATYLAVWTYFIGGAYGAYESSHISAALLDVIVKNDRVLGIIDFIVKLITVFISIWMAVWAVQYLGWSLAERPHSMELQMPLYLVHLSMAIGLVLMAFYFAIALGLAALRLFGKAPGGNTSEGLPS